MRPGLKLERILFFSIFAVLVSACGNDSVEVAQDAAVDAVVSYWHCEELQWCSDGMVYQEYTGGYGGCKSASCPDGVPDVEAIFQCPSNCLLEEDGEPICRSRDDSPDIAPFGPPEELCAP